MGNLTPGEALIYERVDGVIYSRKFGQSDRTVVGYDWDVSAELEKVKHDRFWAIDIHEAARTNAALQKALEQCIILYKLTQEAPQLIQHHPV